MLVYLVLLCCQFLLTSSKQCCSDVNSYMIPETMVCSGSHAPPDIDCDLERLTLLYSPKFPDIQFNVNNVTNHLDVTYHMDTVFYDQYCLTKVERRSRRDGRTAAEGALVCFHENLPTLNDVLLDDELFKPYTTFHTLYIVALSVSIVFLLLTLVVYVMVPELRDLDGKIMMCLVVTYALSCVGVISITYEREFSFRQCAVQALLSFFALFSSSYWLHIVAVNLWRRAVFPKCYFTDRQLFMIYNLIAFGVPTFQLSYYFLHFPWDASYDDGLYSCYELVPTDAYILCILIFDCFINPILLFCTAFLLFKSRHTERHPRSLRAKFNLYLMLFAFVWCSEVCSHIFSSTQTLRHIFFILDGLTGFYTFMVLIPFRRRVRRSLAIRKLFRVSWPTEWTLLVDNESEPVRTEHVELADANEN